MGIGYSEVYGKVIEDSDLSDFSVRLYTLILYLCGPNNHMFFSRQHIANLMGVSKQTVDRGYKQLKSKGLISVKKRMGLNSITYLESVENIYP